MYYVFLNFMAIIIENFANCCDEYETLELSQLIGVGKFSASHAMLVCGVWNKCTFECEI